MTVVSSTSVPRDQQLSRSEESPLASPWAIEVQDIRVAYRSYKEHPATLKEALLKALKKGRLKYYSTFDALSGVSFRVKRGSVFGIVGSNGAGKSTLLKVLSGVLPPTEGTVTVEGTVDSLIQLGAGFDSDLNAIENIYLNCALHKQSRFVTRTRVAHILNFAELEEFSHTPIRYYSSGMFARLGFSVAVDRCPDVLLVDEVLAVGDERFQEKCRGIFASLLEQGKTIVMVSHSMNTLEKLCSEIMVLSKGEVVFQGNPKEAIEIYRNKHYKTALKS